jgi:transposase
VQHVQRIQKALEDANIKIDSVISDVMGTSGRRILRALIAGERDPEKLVEVTTGRLRASRETLVEALRGYVTKHHRFLLKLHLDQVQAIEQAIASVEEEVGESLKPFRERADLLTTIPGIDATVAHVIVAEIGVNMSRFPTAAHLRSWAGFCPRNDQSAGKRRSNRIRKGAPWLKTVLVQAAWAAVHTKGT